VEVHMLKFVMLYRAMWTWPLLLRNYVYAQNVDSRNPTVMASPVKMKLVLPVARPCAGRIDSWFFVLKSNVILKK